jgi:hypothetical protein
LNEFSTSVVGDDLSFREILTRVKQRPSMRLRREKTMRSKSVVENRW